MSDTWYRDPRANQIYPRGVLAMLVDDIVTGLLGQIEARRCPLCERLTGYAHKDWPFRQRACGNTVCRWFVAGRLDMFRPRAAGPPAAP